MIHFDPAQQVFVLQGRSSAYVLRVLPSGEVVHVSFRPAPTSNTPPSVTHLDAYRDNTFVTDLSGRVYEHPAQGDVHYHPAALRVSFPQAPGPLQPGEANHLPVRDLRLRYAGHAISRTEQPALAPQHGLPTAVTTPRDTLCLRLRDAAYPFDVTVFYRLTPEHDIVERWIELHNPCPFPVEIERCDFGVLHLPNGRYEALHTSGVWASEFTLTRHPLNPGRFVLENTTLTTGHFTNPFFYLVKPGQHDEAAGEVYFGALAYSGNWHLEFDARPTGPLQVSGGYHPDGTAFPLAAGETHRTPALVFGCTTGGLSGASQQLHAFARERILPCPPHAPHRPVLYNSWEATYFNVTEQNQISLARSAAALGVELFAMDDGWFGARRHDKAGLGDWFVRSDAFPRGLKPLIDEVHRLGMQFGLWMEPEMVNPDSDLYRAHPDWILHFPGRPRTTGRNQFILDFGRPEVVQYIETCFEKIVGGNAIDFIKWDMNRYPTEPGSVAGVHLWRRHVEAIYGLIDRLRARYPRLTIESCSGGGGRVDLGMLARVDQAWTSDNTDAFHRIHLQEGYSHAYPARTMMNWVTHEKNHQTHRVAPLALRFDVAMRGALGIGSSIDALSEEEKAEYARYIAFYKRIRPVVQDGSLYRLEAIAAHGVSAWQFLSADRRQAVLSLVEHHHRFGDLRAPLRLRDLVADATYQVSNYQGEDRGTFSGWQLMAIGFPPHAEIGGRQEGRSETLVLEARPSQA